MLVTINKRIPQAQFHISRLHTYIIEAAVARYITQYVTANTTILGSILTWGINYCHFLTLLTRLARGVKLSHLIRNGVS